MTAATGLPPNTQRSREQARHWGREALLHTDSLGSCPATPDISSVLKFLFEEQGPTAAH